MVEEEGTLPYLILPFHVGRASKQAKTSKRQKILFFFSKKKGRRIGTYTG